MALFPRKIVGWAMDATMHRHLGLTALDLAVVDRQVAPGLIHHSDRGRQYASADDRAALDAHGIVASMSRLECCYDHAGTESFGETLKNELIHRRDYHAQREAKQAIFETIEVFYNGTRQHTTIGNLSPVDVELQRAESAQPPVRTISTYWIAQRG